MPEIQCFYYINLIPISEISVFIISTESKLENKAWHIQIRCPFQSRLLFHQTAFYCIMRRYSFNQSQAIKDVSLFRP